MKSPYVIFGKLHREILPFLNEEQKDVMNKLAYDFSFTAPENFAKNFGEYSRYLSRYITKDSEVFPEVEKVWNKYIEEYEESTKE